MTKIKATKRSLIGSIMALVFCCSIFMGTTFAWFTSSATTNVNTIRAGKLKVGLVDARDNTKSLVGQTLNFEKASGGANEQILWEPGCTYNLQPFKVVNRGELALKYKLVINGIDGDSKLLEVIDFKVNINGVETNLENYEETLLAGKASQQEVVISGHMKEEAGNEYQGLTLSGISIQVVAAQATVEHDSIGNQYDADTEYPVTNTNELKASIAAAKSGDTIVLATGEFSLPSDIKEGITIIGSGNTVIVPEGTNTNNVVNAKNITVKNVTFAADEGKNAANGIALKFTGSGTFTDCTFTGSNGVRWSYANGDVVFKGCKIGSPNGIYGVHFDGGKGKVSLIDCEINGWTSFGSQIEKVTIENSKLFNNYSTGSYKVLRFYQDATISNCTFPDDMIEISGAKAGITININKCDNKVSGFITDYTNPKTVKFFIDGKAAIPR